MDQKTAARNARFVYIIEAFESASWSIPIWLLFFTRQLGFSLQLAAAIGMTRWITQAICNVPTGALAGRYGRVKLYKYGQLGFALSYAPFLFTKNVPILFVVQILGGLFGSMTVGALRPVVQEAFKKADFSDQKYKHFVSNATITSYASRLLAGVIGAWLYIKHPFMPYALLIPSLSAAWFLSFFLREPKRAHSVNSNRKHISDALKYAYNNKQIRLFFIGIIFLVISTESIWTAFQPYFVAREVPVALFGVLFGLVAMSSMIGAYFARKLPHKVNGLRVYLFICLNALLISILMSLKVNWLAYVVVVTAGFAWGFIDPINHYVIQREVDIKYQSTVLSLKSFVYTGSFALTSIAVGFYVDHFGVETMHKILVFQALTCLIVVFILKLLSAKKVKL